MNYQLQLRNYLNKIYDKKIYEILIKENIDELNNMSLDDIKLIINSKEVFLGNDLDNFIIDLIPQGFDGYLLRESLSKNHNITYPILYNSNGYLLKNYTHNNFSTILWEDFTNKTFIKDLDRLFNKEDFNKYVNENLDIIYNSIINKIKLFKNNNKITIPYTKNNLVDTFKSMILNNQLDFSYALLTVDMNLLRNHMMNLSVSVDLYDEFDKLEDDLEECLNNFFKYNEEDLLDVLINKENFQLIDNKLIKFI